MPEKIGGYDKDGNLKWFEGHSLPEGYTTEKPSEKDVVVSEERPKAKKSK